MVSESTIAAWGLGGGDGDAGGVRGHGSGRSGRGGGGSSNGLFCLFRFGGPAYGFTQELILA